MSFSSIASRPKLVLSISLDKYMLKHPLAGFWDLGPSNCQIRRSGKESNASPKKKKKILYLDETSPLRGQANNKIFFQKGLQEKAGLLK